MYYCFGWIWFLEWGSGRYSNYNSWGQIASGPTSGNLWVMGIQLTIFGQLDCNLLSNKDTFLGWLRKDLKTEIPFSLVKEIFQSQYKWNQIFV